MVHKMTPKIIFTSQDYEGELNLLVSERMLILESAIKYDCHRRHMAVGLGVSLRTVIRKIRQHGLERLFSSRNRNTLIVSEIRKLEKGYPLVLESHLGKL